MLVAVLRLLGRLPLSWLHCAGAALGWLTYWTSPTYAARLRENLRASGVCSGESQCDAMRRAAIAETGKSLTELAVVWFGSNQRVEQLVTVSENWDVVDAARRRGRGILFLTPHLGCFEISALYVARHFPIIVLYRPPKLAWIEPLMAAGRNRWQAVSAPANMRGVRMLYRALARGDAVGLLPDQAPGVGEGVWAEFFGRPAYTMTLVGRLQQATGAAIVLAVAKRLPDGRGYHLRFEELPVPVAGLDEVTLNRAVESLVRSCPEQYLWSYNRYKVPAGAEPPPTQAEVESRKAKVS